MLKIGMVGEYPADVDCITNLLVKKYGGQVTFSPLLYDVHGSNLENPKIKHQLRREYQIEKPDRVLFTRDLDGLEDNFDLLGRRWAYFAEFNSVVNKKGLLLLNIYGLEALLLSDIGKIESFYHVKLSEIIDCMNIVDPKGFLRQVIRDYSTGDNVALFSLLDFDVVVNRCRYFKDFNNQFGVIVNN